MDSPLIQKQIRDDGIVHLKDPRPKRDFIHVNDVVSAFIKAIEFEKTDFEIINLGAGVSYSVKEIAEMLVTKSGKNISIDFSEEHRKNEVLDTVANINKIKTLLKWQPNINIEKGLEISYEGVYKK